MRRLEVRCIPTPEWARTPDVWLDLKLADYQALQVHRERMLAVVHRMVEDHLTVSGYIAKPGDEAASGLESFPSSGRLSGEYYIGDESYTMEVGPLRFRISIMARCLSRSPQEGSVKRDYLGLEAWLECLPDEWEFKPESHLNVSVI